MVLSDLYVLNVCTLGSGISHFNDGVSAFSFYDGSVLCAEVEGNWLVLHLCCFAYRLVIGVIMVNSHSHKMFHDLGHFD